MDSTTFQIVRYHTNGDGDFDILLEFDADSMTVRDGLVIPTGSTETRIIMIGSNQYIRERNPKRFNQPKRRPCPECGKF
jgi:hypothetical protein